MLIIPECIHKKLCTKMHVSPLRFRFEKNSVYIHYYTGSYENNYTKYIYEPQ